MADENKKNNTPESLVKYYKCDKHSLSVLKEMKIWASNPLHFNDPFDCAAQFWKLENFPPDFIIHDFKKLLPKIDLKSYTKPDLRNFYFQNFLQLWGVFCLNDEKNEDIFWGYYSDQKGFSIKFDYLKLKKNWGLEPHIVNYKSVEEIRLLRAELSEDSNVNTQNALVWLTTKKDSWTQENEWRFIFSLDITNKAPRKIEFVPEAIQEITLGFKFFEEAKQIYLKNGISSFIFKKNPLNRKNFHFEIIKLLKGEIDSSLSHIVLDENFNLIHLPISILKICKNEVTIKHHYSPEQLEIMDFFCRK